MRIAGTAFLAAVGLAPLLALAGGADNPDMAPPVDLRNQPAMTWIKRTPGPGAPVNPRMGYEASMGWDAAKGIIIRYNIYRKQHRWNSSTIDRLNARPVAVTAFTDARAGQKTHRYFVAAVDALGQEGLISSPVWSYREWRKYYVPFVGQWHQ